MGFIILLSLLGGIAKYLHDVSGDTTLWFKSPLKRFKIDSFFGPREYTYKRKYHKNKFISFFTERTFVFISDIWHASEMVMNLSVFLIIVQYSLKYALIWYVLKTVSSEVFFTLLKVSKDQIKCFIQGWVRYIFPFLMKKEIRQQINDRLDNPKTLSCRLLGKCKNCGCQTPQVFYCDKQCDECYEKIQY